MKNFGVAADLEIIQELLDLTVTELAQQLGVTHQSIYNWKANEEQITQKNLEKFMTLRFVRVSA